MDNSTAASSEAATSRQAVWGFVLGFLGFLLVQDVYRIAGVDDSVVAHPGFGGKLKVDTAGNAPDFRFRFFILNRFNQDWYGKTHVQLL